MNDDLNVNSDKKLSINSDINSHILSENEILKTSIRQNILKNITTSNNNFNIFNNVNKTKIKIKESSDEEFILNKDNSNNQLNNNENENFTKMYFGTENLTTISTQVGSIAVVPCEVHHIGEGVVSISINTLCASPSISLFWFILFVQVSWIRKTDYHLLTVGLTTYSSDERFSTIHSQESEVCLWPNPSCQQITH